MQSAFRNQGSNFWQLLLCIFYRYPPSVVSDFLLTKHFWIYGYKVSFYPGFESHTYGADHAMGACCALRDKLWSKIFQCKNQGWLMSITSQAATLVAARPINYFTIAIVFWINSVSSSPFSMLWLSKARR